jgi:hypothetical protein
MKILFVAAAVALVVGAISGCTSIAAYQASHLYCKFPGSGTNS